MLDSLYFLMKEIIRLLAKELLVKVLCINCTMNWPLWSGSDRTYSKIYFLSWWITVVTTCNKSHTWVWLSIKSWCTSIYHYLPIPCTVSSQVLSRLHIVQCTDNQVKLRIKVVIIVFLVINAPLNCLNVHLRHQFQNLLFCYSCLWLL